MLCEELEVLGPPQALLNSTGPLPAELARTTGQRTTDASSPSTCLKGGGAYSLPQPSASPPPLQSPASAPSPAPPPGGTCSWEKFRAPFPSLESLPQVLTSRRVTWESSFRSTVTIGDPCKCTRPQPFRQHSTVTHSSPPHSVGCTKGRLGEAVDRAVERERM